jgi:hypothetical protein
LDRTREHRTFRRIRAARLEELVSESRSAGAKTETPPEPEAPSEPATGPDAGSTDRGGGLV